MKTPPFLLGATLMFWGWLTGQLFLAAIMALVLEGSRLTQLRWDFSTSDFNRISDFCSIILIGMVVYLLASNKSFKTILIFLQWLPVALFPLLIFCVYSTTERVDISALFLIIRKKMTQEGKRSGISIHLAYPYFILCILSASASNVRDISFYAGLLLLSAWALWTIRSKRFSPILWGFLILLVGTGGYAGHIGLHGLQNIIEEKGAELFVGLSSPDADPFRRTTAIGDIGTLKLSDRVLFRVETGHTRQSPMLLREASYNVYRSSQWFAFRSQFSRVQPDADGTTWTFQPEPDKSEMITVSTRLKRGKGILKLPNGTFQISDLPVSTMEQNQSGAVKVEEGPGFIAYRVKFSERTSLDGPTNPEDLSVPQSETYAISRITKELRPESKSPGEILNSLKTFFQTQYQYSLILDRKDSSVTPLTHFLLQSRSGHCEYFATASVLLLRAMGLPARYASGFSVQEFSRLENRWIVRARHAHAWALVYIEGAWQDFDPTPSSWIAIEADTASVWEPLFDIGSLGLFKFSEWRWRERKSGMPTHMLWLLVLLLIVLGRRFYIKRKFKRVKLDQHPKTMTVLRPGTDSEFYKIEKRLNEWGFVRYPCETYSSWIRRIEETGPADVSMDRLRYILALHYQYRFDPKGVSPAEKSALESSAELWLAEHGDIMQRKQA